MPKEDIPPGVFVYIHEKDWMEEQGVLLWIEKVWESCPGQLLRKKTCLVYDMFKDSTKNKLQEGSTDVAIMPGDLTSQLQPLINKPFKEKVRILWMAGSMDHTLTLGAKGME